MSIDAIIFNKIPANQIQEHIKITHHDQVSFTQEMQGGFFIQKSVNIIHHMNQLKEKFTHSSH